MEWLTFSGVISTLVAAATGWAIGQTILNTYRLRRLENQRSGEQTMWTALALAVIVYYMLELRRQLEETREHVETLHNDVRDEIYQRYGERFDGKK